MLSSHLIIFARLFNSSARAASYVGTYGMYPKGSESFAIHKSGKMGPTWAETEGTSTGTTFGHVGLCKCADVAYLWESAETDAARGNLLQNIFKNPAESQGPRKNQR